MSEGIPGEAIIFFSCIILVVAFLATGSAIEYVKNRYEEYTKGKSKMKLRRNRKSAAQIQKEVDSLAEIVSKYHHESKDLKRQLEEAERMRDYYFNEYFNALVENGKLKRD